MIKAIIALMVYLSCASAYSQIRPFNAAEKQKAINKLIYSQPDSAKVLIKEIINYKGTLPDTTYAVANIFYGYYHFIKNNPDSSIYYYKRSLPYTNDAPILYVQAIKNMAAAYRKKTDYTESLRLLGIAEDKFRALKNNRGVAMVYGEMASNYNQMLKSDEAIPYLLKAIAILEKEKESVDIYVMKQSLANTFLNIENFRSAADLYPEVLAGFKKANRIKNYYLTLLNYGDALTSLKRYDEAKKVISEAIEGLTTYNDTDLMALGYTILGRIESNRSNIPQSITYYDKALDMALSINSSRVVPIAAGYVATLMAAKRFPEAIKVIERTDKQQYKSIANLRDLTTYEKSKAHLYKLTQKDELAIASYKKVMELQDTLKKTRKVDEVIELQGEYEHNVNAKKADKLVKANAKLQEAVTGYHYKKAFRVGIPALVLLILVFLYIRKSKKHKEKMGSELAKTQKLSQEFEGAKKINQKLKEGIQKKQGELLANTFEMAGVQENINLMIEHCNALSPGSKDIGTIKSSLRDIISDKDYWDLFRETFSQAYADFQEKVSAQFPQLNKKELFLCSLLNLKIPTKDLAVIFQATPEMVRKRTYRLRAKMDIASDEEMDAVFANLWK